MVTRTLDGETLWDVLLEGTDEDGLHREAVMSGLGRSQAMMYAAAIKEGSEGAIKARVVRHHPMREASSDDHFYGPWKGGSKAEGGSPANAKSLSAEQADERLRVLGVEARTDDIHPEHRAVVVKEFEAMNERHPGLFKAVAVELETTWADDAEIAAAESFHSGGTMTSAGYRTGRAVISLNDTHWAKPESMQRQMAIARSKDWFADPTPGGLLRHELGHVFESAVQGPAGQAAPEQWRRFASLAVGTGGPSGYAHTSMAERFAEHYAWIAGGHKPTTDEGRAVAALIEAYR